MKKLFTILTTMLITATAWAQSPEKMSYQAVIRDASDQLVTNQDMGMQISILQGSTSGTAVYVETHSTTSNANGLVSIEIGTGATSDDFSAIDWANGIYFIKTETDPTTAGGTNYTITGTSQLLSVPFALHAKTAESITGTVNYTETDPVFGASIANDITAVDTANWNNKLDTEIDGSITNEIQALSISNDTIYLSNGGVVKLPVGFDGQYSSLTGVPTNVSTFTNDAGYITEGNWKNYEYHAKVLSTGSFNTPTIFSLLGTYHHAVVNVEVLLTSYIGTEQKIANITYLIRKQTGAPAITNVQTVYNSGSAAFTIDGIQFSGDNIYFKASYSGLSAVYADFKVTYRVMNPY